MVRLRERDLGELTELGTVVGLYYEDDEQGYEVAFDDVVLFWSHRAQALVWWDGAEDPPELEAPTTDLDGGHVDTWRTWTRGAEVDGVVEAHTPETTGRPRDIGLGVWVDYDSTKFGKLDSYRHRFGPGVVVASTTGDVVLWVVQGGGLHITEQGLIEG